MAFKELIQVDTQDLDDRQLKPTEYVYPDDPLRVKRTIHSECDGEYTFSYKVGNNPPPQFIQDGGITDMFPLDLCSQQYYDFKFTHTTLSADLTGWECQDGVLVNTDGSSELTLTIDNVDPLSKIGLFTEFEFDEDDPNTSNVFTGKYNLVQYDYPPKSVCEDFYRDEQFTNREVEVEQGLVRLGTWTVVCDGADPLDINKINEADSNYIIFSDPGDVHNEEILLPTHDPDFGLSYFPENFPIQFMEFSFVDEMVDMEGDIDIVFYHANELGQKVEVDRRSLKEILSISYFKIADNRVRFPMPEGTQFVGFSFSPNDPYFDPNNYDYTPLFADLILNQGAYEIDLDNLRGLTSGGEGYLLMVSGIFPQFFRLNDLTPYIGNIVLDGNYKEYEDKWKNGRLQQFGDFSVGNWDFDGTKAVANVLNSPFYYKVRLEPDEIFIINGSWGVEFKGGLLDSDKREDIFNGYYKECSTDKPERVGLSADWTMYDTTPYLFNDLGDHTATYKFDDTALAEAGTSIGIDEIKAKVPEYAEKDLTYDDLEFTVNSNISFRFLHPDSYAEMYLIEHTESGDVETRIKRLDGADFFKNDVVYSNRNTEVTFSTSYPFDVEWRYHCVDTGYKTSVPVEVL